MSFECKFCGAVEDHLYQNFFPLCCNKAIYNFKDAYIEIKELKVKKK